MQTIYEHCSSYCTTVLHFLYSSNKNLSAKVLLLQLDTYDTNLDNILYMCKNSIFEKKNLLENDCKH